MENILDKTDKIGRPKKYSKEERHQRKLESAKKYRAKSQKRIAEYNKKYYSRNKQVKNNELYKYIQSLDKDIKIKLIEQLENKKNTS